MAKNHENNIKGYLASKPVLRHTPQGTPVTTLRVGVNVYRGEGRPAETFWYNVECWQKTAEACCRYLDKGSHVEVTGEMRQPRIWTGRDGQVRCDLEMNADPAGVEFLDRAPQGARQAAPQQHTQEEAPVHLLEEEIAMENAGQRVLTSGEMSLDIDMASPI